MRNENPIFRFARGESKRDGMNRREMVQRLIGTAGGGAALVTLGPMAAAAEGKPGPAPSAEHNNGQQSGSQTPAATGEWSPAFLDAHQNETVTVLGERIIPGSSKAEVNRMIDLLLTVDSQQNQRRFIVSLSAFDAEALARHRQPFASLTEEQQRAILTAASTAEAGPKEPEADWDPWSSAPSSTSASESALTLRDHFEIVKDWVARSYYSSEIGLRELGWTGRLAWDKFPSCDHPDGHA